VTLPQDTISVYVFSTDQLLWHRWWDETYGWHGWELQDKFDETPQVTSAPAVAKRGSGGTDLFACGLSDELRARSFIGGPPDPWTPWGSLGGKLTSAPAAVSKVPGQLDVFAHGTDGALWTKWYNEREGWSEWGSLGSPTEKSTPLMGWQLLDNNPATMQIVADGGNLYQLHTNGKIWQYTGTPLTGWQQLDSNPATMQIVADGGNLYELYTTGSIWRYTK
jgi:hypothetical protein